jgi:hypothetical protein
VNALTKHREDTSTLPFDEIVEQPVCLGAAARHAGSTSGDWKRGHGQDHP